jgi:hypothetical protein
MPRLFVLAVTLALAACAGSPPAEPAPPVPIQPGPTSAADPARQAVLSAAYTFTDTRIVADRPADAARAAAQIEWMAAALPGDPRWTGTVPTLFPALRQARAEMRQTLGIAPGASAVAATRGLVEAAAALDQGSRSAAVAALAPVAPGGGQAVLARLDALPQMPRAALAARLAQDEMLRISRDDPG